MDIERRQFVASFASVGVMGAATLAMTSAAGAAALKATEAKRGPGLDGPYLDLRTGKGNQLAYARIQGDLDFGKQKHFWFKGYVMGVRPDKKIDDLFGSAGFGTIRLRERPDGAIERLCREIILYTDLKTGEVLEEWKNPYLDETVKVVQVSNDPFNYLIEEFFPAPPSFGGLNKEKAPPRVPFVLPWSQQGGRLDMEMHIHLLYPNALQPDKWPRESNGPMVQVSEFFAHHVSAADMQNPKITSLDYCGVWNRTTPWLPWMLMGQAPGHCQYACFMGTTGNLEEVHSRPLLDHAHKHYAKFFEAPTEYGERSLSSLENYAREQQPAPPKK